MDQHHSASSRENLASFLGWFLFACQALALSVEVFLHRSSTFGRRYIGLQAGMAVLLIIFYPVFWTGHDPRPMLGFLIAFLFMNLMARISRVLRRREVEDGHSLYSGYPRIMRFTGRVSELTVKRGIEPFLVFFTGIFILPVNQPLGSYLMLAAFGLFTSVNMGLAFERTRAIEMHDAYLEQRSLAEQLRDMRDD